MADTTFSLEGHISVSKTAVDSNPVLSFTNAGTGNGIAAADGSSSATAYGYGSETTLGLFRSGAGFQALAATVAGNAGALVKNYGASGTTTRCGFSVYSDGGGSPGNLSVNTMSPGWTTSGLLVASSAAISTDTNTTNGLVIYTLANANVRFGVNGALVGAFTTAPNFSLVSGSSVVWTTSSSDPTGAADTGLARGDFSSSGLTTGVITTNGSSGFLTHGALNFQMSQSGQLRWTNNTTPTTGLVTRIWRPAGTSGVDQGLGFDPNDGNFYGTVQYARGFTTTSSLMFAWSSTGSADGSIDTNISRNAAGVVQVGTTAANANGSIAFNNTVITGKTIDTTAGDAATINSLAGRFRKDTSGTTFTLTNNKITSNSIILLTAANAAIDATATGWTVVAGSGSATIEFNAAPTANFDMNFLVIN